MVDLTFDREATKLLEDKSKNTLIKKYNFTNGKLKNLLREEGSFWSILFKVEEVVDKLRVIYGNELQVRELILKASWEENPCLPDGKYMELLFENF